MKRLRRTILVAVLAVVLVVGMAVAAYAPEAGQYCSLNGPMLSQAGSNGGTIYCSGPAGNNGAGRWVY